MPIYEYQCLPNSHRFEVRHGITENPIQECQICGGPVRRVIHPVGIVFKGSGFYATDSRKSESQKPAETSGSSDGKSDGKSESKTESTSEKKTESSSDSGTP